MSPIRLLKRLLGAAAIAATGASADAAADIGEPAPDATDERPADLDGGDPARSPHSRPVELAKLGGLVDGLGPVDPGLAAVMVGTALAAAHPVERIAFVCEWATSSSLVRRRALARALSHPFACAGALTAIEVLAHDADPLVRSAARQAALLRVGHDPERYEALLKG